MSDKKDHLVTCSDIRMIVSNAKSGWVNMHLPLKVSNRTLDFSEPAHVAMIEAVVSYLNRNGLLNNAVKIDYDGQ